MRTIYRIAKKELQLLFYSPIAWVLLLCFIVQTALQFTAIYEQMVMDVEGYGNSYWCTFRLFAAYSPAGVWLTVQNFLYFYIPLLTMGIVSREYSSGAIKLLYSSPVSDVQIILGKYLAMVFYAVILISVLLVYVVFSWCTVENFEISWVLSGLLGLFLLVCTYMAVGIFVSSLTSYQLIAAVGTFIVLMLLSAVSGWGQQYDVVRDITYWLSINGRSTTFIQGMLCSEDLIYFPVITAMFLTFTVIRLSGLRQKQRFSVTFGKYAVVLAIVCVFAYLSSRPVLTGYYDMTSNKQNTLSVNSRNIVKQVTGGLTITSYVNVLDPGYLDYRYPQFITQNREFFKKYVRFKPETRLKVVYYYADTENRQLDEAYKGYSTWQKARKVCEMYEIDSTILKSKEEIDKMVDLSVEGYTFIRQFVRDNGQKEWLRAYENSMKPDEPEISATLKRMVMTLPKIGFVAGHGEREMYGNSLQGYSYIASNKKIYASVWNRGFDVEEIGLSQAVPEDISILIIADPRVAFSEEEEGYLQEYLDKGGSLMFLGEPRRNDIVNPMLRRLFGLELTPLLVKQDIRFGKVSPDILVCPFTREATGKIRFLSSAYGVCMPTTAGVEIVEEKGYDSFSIAKCDTLSPCWTELETTDFLDDSIKFNPKVGEYSKVFTTVMGLTRKVNDKEQRIIISGDADVLSNNEFVVRRFVSSQNQYLLLGGCYWLSHEQAPIYISREGTRDNRVNLNKSEFKIMRWGFVGGIPFVLLAIAVYVWLRRRGR